MSWWGVTRSKVIYMNVFTILYDLIKILGYPGLSSVCQAYQQEMVRSQTRLPSTSIKARYPGEHQKVGTWMFIHPFMWNIPGVEITVLTIPEAGCLSCHSTYPNGDSMTGSLISISISNDSQVDGSECLMLR